MGTDPGPPGPRPEPAARPTPADLAAAVGGTIPDVIGPDLRVLFCGINPGRRSGATGHHFAHPGNRFWKALLASGFTDQLLRPDQQDRLVDYGIGITNLVARTTAAAAELSKDELHQGGVALADKVARFHPLAVAFLGLTAYRTAFGRPRAAIGPQDDRLGPARLWVLPNPSGLQGYYGLDRIVAELDRLRAAVSEGSKD